MTDLPFSEKYGYAPDPTPKPDDHFPGWVRYAIANEIKILNDNSPSSSLPYIDLYSFFRPYIWKVLDTMPPGNPMGGPWAHYIPATLLKCPWWQYYDILEQLTLHIEKRWGGGYTNDFSAKVNTILAREGIQWKLENGKVVRVLNPQIEKQVKEVSILLASPKFKGPDEQFAKALESLNKRPEPDKENCVKDAVGAIEAVANIIADTRRVQLNTLLNREPFRSNVPPTIREAIEKIYAYRGASPGVAHGQVGPSVVSIAEATWVLATSAATMLYLASLMLN